MMQLLNLFLNPLAGSRSGPMAQTVQSNNSGRTRQYWTRRPGMELRFVTTRRDTRLVSIYEIYYMEDSFARLGVPSVIAQRGAFTEFVAKVLMKLKLIRRIVALGKRIYIVPVFHLAEFNLFPRAYFAKVATYSFDVWPNRYGEWERFFRRHRPVVAFISAKSSVEYMRKHVPGIKFVWAPEAACSRLYNPRKELAVRSIDVLELGRRFESYHRAITAGLAERGKVHLYEKEKGKKIFGSHDDLIKGFSDSKLFVCFPASMTDGFAGGVETVTLRYIQACASGCVPVGHAPAELIELFGYNPVVEIDMQRPLQHTLEILDHIDDWQGLVRKNYARFLEVGTWDARAADMLRAVQEALAA
jgi:hypothetical protein